MHLYYAQTIAENLKQCLEPYCEKIYIAGSIRRKKQEVKDIELVLIPKKSMHKETNLFGETVREYKVVHPESVKELHAIGKVEKGKVDGRYMKIEVKQLVESVEHLISLDLFMPRKEDFYRQLAIRTGSADYAHRYISSYWKKRGWVGINGELYLMRECMQISEKEWVLKKDITNPTRPPVWQSEQEFFKWLGIQYLAPEQRNL